MLLLPVGDWRILAGVLAIIAMVYAGFGRVGMARLKLLRPLLPLLMIVGGVQTASAAGMPVPSSPCGCWRCCCSPISSA